MNMHWLGIDVGTGGTRVVAIDALGGLMAAASEEHAHFASPRAGWAEQDPRDWYRATQIAIRRILEKIPAESIAGIGFSGQMHGSVLLDERNEVLRPALLWCDQRTQGECEAITQRLGAARLIELASNPALTGFTLPKLLWMRTHEPELWKRARHLLLPKDYVRFRLCGEHATDVADASGTLMLDVARRRWSSEILSAFDLDERILPALHESHEITGRVSKQAALETGLREGTLLIAGAGDQAAGAVGMGIVAPGLVSATIGTSGVVFAATDKPVLDPQGRVHAFCHAVPGLWHVMGVTLAAGLSLRWFRDVFGAGMDDGRDPYERLSDEARSVAPGAEGVLWAPYLMGERTPHLDPNARAAIVGLAVNHGRGHIVRAILEGVAFSQRDSFEIFRQLGIPLRGIRLGGGGARGVLWRQIQADIYGHAVEIPRTEEGAAFGAALLAGVGTGHWKNVPEACKESVHIATLIEPNPAHMQILDKHYRAYRALYLALKGVSSHG